MTLAGAPKTGSTTAAPPREGRRGESSLTGWLPYLIPPVAGLSLGVGIDCILTNDTVIDVIWTGGSIDPESMPSALLTKAGGVAVGIVLWLASAAVIGGRHGIRGALRTAAFGLLPFVSVLALNALNSAAGVDIIAWAPMALILSVAFLAAWTVTCAIAKGGSIVTAAAGVVRRHGGLIAVSLGLAYAAISVVMGLLQYRAVMVNYHDSADFEEMLWRTIHGQFLMCSVFPHNFLGEHVEFVHLFLLPIYALWPGMPVLMICMSVALASGVIPVYLLARHKLNSPGAAALFAGAYVLYAPMQYLDKQIIANPFMPEIFSVPIMLWAIYFLVKGRMGWLVVMSLAALTCKEELALPVAMFGVILAARRQWKWGVAFFAGGVAWFLLSLSVVVPYFAHGTSHVFNAQYYGGLGTSMTEIVRNALRHPLTTLSHMVSFSYLDLMVMLLVPLGCFALLSPTALVLCVPSIATAALSSWPPFSAIYFHYHFVLTPLLTAGAVLGAANVVRILGRLTSVWGRIEPQARGGLVAAACGVLVLASSATFDVVYGKMPWSLAFYNPKSNGYWHHLYIQTPSARAFLTKALPLIPRDATVTATGFLQTQLTHRAACFQYPDGLDKAEYAVIQQYESADAGMAFSLMQTVQNNTEILGFERIFAEEGIFVFRRKEGQAPSSAPGRQDEASIPRGDILGR